MRQQRAEAVDLERNSEEGTNTEEIGEKKGTSRLAPDEPLCSGVDKRKRFDQR